jgi:neutral ceramidase
MGTGCTLFPGRPLEIPGFQTEPFPKPKGADFFAGVGRADITPPPGYPTGGHGPAGGVARGYWTRLWARAFYFETADARLVLVSCDLFMVPGALQDLVASRLQNRGIAPGELVLAATHTHQSAGNYASARAYNEFGSHDDGFSMTLLSFLADRIAFAITEAQSDARLYPDKQVEIVRHTGTLDGVLMNRSPRSFLLNPDRDEIMNTFNPGISANPYFCAAQRLDCDPEIDWQIVGCPRLRAVDNRITAVEIKRDGTLVGLMLFLAFHPTALEHEAGVYSGDVAELVVGSLERSTSPKIPMAAFFNGAQGDISLRRCRRDVLDVTGLARNILGTVRPLIGTPGTPQSKPLHLKVAYADLLPGEQRKCVSTEFGRFTIAKEPQPGVALLGGGEGDRTVLFQLGWTARIKGTAEKGQGPKMPGLDSSIVTGLKLNYLLAPPWKWSQRLPLSFINLGDMRLLVTPVEMTTAMAYRLRAKFFHDPTIEMLLIGLANDYVSYATTPEEYMAQEYSAASTLWGPSEGPYIGCELADLLVDQTKSPPPRRMDSRSYYPGFPPTSPFGPAFLGNPRLLPTEGIEMVLLDTDGRPAPDLPWFQWPEKREGVLSEDIEAADFKAAAKRRLSIYEWQGNSWQLRSTNALLENDDGPDDDSGFNLLTVLMRGSKTCDLKYAGVWLRPFRGPIGGRFRFQVARPDGTSVCSYPFVLPSTSTGSSEVPCDHCDDPSMSCK